MKATQKDLQALRLLRAFSEITDQQARESVTLSAERARDTERGKPSSLPDCGILSSD